MSASQKGGLFFGDIKRKMTKEQLTGAELVIRGLEYLNVSTVFGVPGGAILPAYDPLYDSPIRHILARHCLLYTSPSPRD